MVLFHFRPSFERHTRVEHIDQPYLCHAGAQWIAVCQSFLRCSVQTDLRGQGNRGRRMVGKGDRSGARLGSDPQSPQHILRLA